MTTTTYKGYTIRTVGISRYIFEPGQEIPITSNGSAKGYAQSMAEAKRWINAAIKEIRLENNTLKQELKNLAYVRSGSGSTAGYKIVITKNMTDDNVEAVTLLAKTLFQEVIKSSRGTYFCKGDNQP